MYALNKENKIRNDNKNPEFITRDFYCRYAGLVFFLFNIQFLHTTSIY